MRRPRPHRLTGSIPRLAAAAVLALCGGAALVTAATAAGSGLEPAASRALPLPTLPLPTSLPTLPPLPTLPLPTLPIPSVLPSSVPSLPPSPSLPGGPTPPGVCAVNCSTPAPGGGGQPGSGGGTTTGQAGSSAALGGGSVPEGSSPAFDTVTSAHTAGGLALSGPANVAHITPVGGLSFGKAPYLWPLFLLLDVTAAAVVVGVVRKSWSATPGGD